MPIKPCKEKEEVKFDGELRFYKNRLEFQLSYELDNPPNAEKETAKG